MNYEMSFIIPVYNKKVEQLSECIDSIIGIKKHSFEIIIIDDGSIKSNSKEYQKLISNKTNIKYFYQNNKGVSCARNLGITKAVGKYIFFVDADDRVNTKTFDTINLKGNTSSMIIFNVEKIDLVNHHKKIYGLDKTNKLTQKSLLLQMLKDGVLNWVYAKFYLREWLIDNKLVFDSSRQVGEDLDFVYRAIKKAETIDYNKEIIYFYLFTPDTGIKRIIEYPSENLRDILCIYKLRDGILKEVNPSNKREYKKVIQEKAIDGFFAIYKITELRNIKNANNVESVLKSCIFSLGNISKIDIKSKIKLSIMKHGFLKILNIF